MSTIAMQSVIARLCVDAQFRQSFLGEAEKSLEQYDLTAAELESIKALDMEAVQDYAFSLLGKRAALLKKWLPSTFSYLESTLSPERVRHILRKYSMDAIGDGDEIGGEWLRSESARLCEYFREMIAAGEIESPHLAGLLEFEALTFSMELDPELCKVATDFAAASKQVKLSLTEEFQQNFAPVMGAHVRIREFSFDVAALVEALDNKEPVPELEEAPTWVLIFKIPNSVKAAAHTINLPLKELLELCDGKMSVRETTALIGSRYAEASGSTSAELEDDCLQILDQLYDYGAITFVAKTNSNAAGAGLTPPLV